VALAVIFNAPLGAEANPGMSPNPAKAPWYFLGFQELLLHLHPVMAVVVIPAAALVFFLLLPYLSVRDGIEGVWMMSAIGRRTGLAAVLVGVVATPVLIVADEVLTSPSAATTGLAGVVPVVVIAVVVAAFVIVLRRTLGAPREETVQAVVLLLLTALAVLTVTGVWFRGEGMALVWPWLVP